MGMWVDLNNTTEDGLRWPNTSGLLVNHVASTAVGDEVIQLIAGASEKLLIINPLIQDKLVIERLIEARKRGVRVKVITELRENRGDGIQIPTHGIEVMHAESLDKHFNSVRTLAKNRILCRAMRYYTHAKVVLVDDRVLLLSSANLVPNSLGWSDTPSVEAGVRVDDVAVVLAYSHTLRAIWEACPFRLHLFGTDVTLQEAHAVNIRDRQLECECISGCKMAWSVPGLHYGLRDMLAALCDRAHDRIILAAMTFYDINQVPKLHDALIHALRRGVEVSAIVRPEHFKDSQYPDLSTMRLIAEGMNLYGQATLHAKGALADSSCCGIFSGNLNPYSLECDVESGNIECGLFESGRLHLLDGYRMFLKQLISHASHRYLP